VFLCDVGSESREIPDSDVVRRRDTLGLKYGKSTLMKQSFATVGVEAHRTVAESRVELSDEPGGVFVVRILNEILSLATRDPRAWRSPGST